MGFFKVVDKQDNTKERRMSTLFLFKHKRKENVENATMKMDNMNNAQKPTESKFAEQINPIHNPINDK